MDRYEHGFGLCICIYKNLYTSVTRNTLYMIYIGSPVYPCAYVYDLERQSESISTRLGINLHIHRHAPIIRQSFFSPQDLDTQHVRSHTRQYKLDLCKLPIFINIEIDTGCTFSLLGFFSTPFKHLFTDRSLYVSLSHSLSLTHIHTHTHTHTHTQIIRYISVCKGWKHRRIFFLFFLSNLISKHSKTKTKLFVDILLCSSNGISMRPWF